MEAGILLIKFIRIECTISKFFLEIESRNQSMWIGRNKCQFPDFCLYSGLKNVVKWQVSSILQTQASG